MVATKRTVDMTNVKDGGKFNKKRFPEGDYAAKITKVEDAVSKEKKEPMWLYTIEVRHDGQLGTYPFYCQMAENVLWKLRQLFGAAGIIIPKKRISIDPNKIVGRSIGVTLQDTEYNGKINSEVQFAIPLSDVVSGDEDEEDEEEEEEEEETPPAPKAKPKKPAAEPEPEEEEEEEEDTEDEEEEEPEPTPPPKKRAVKKTAAPTPAAKKKRVVQDEDLEELDLDDL
jgi:hypothetical protein